MKRLLNYKIFEGYNKDKTLLQLSAHDIKELPELSSNLEKLLCNDNFLTSLPELPNSIKVFNCADNMLSYLPKLPESLDIFNCSYNRLKTLPELPESVTQLNCEHNELIYLPKLPEGLLQLYCYKNKLEDLIPTKFLKYQTQIWLDEYYYPFIKSHVGQDKILNKDVSLIKELEEQLKQRNYKLLPEIKKKYAHGLTGVDLNLL